MINKIKQNVDSIFLAVILILALILRFSKMLWQRDFWYDEAFTGIITRMSWSEMWWMIFHDVHPPLYYYLLKPWASLFDYSAFGFRSFSTVFGILSVLSVYWVGKKIFNKRAGLISAFLVAVSPFAVLYSQEARMYSLFGFLVIWWVYFFIKALKSDRIKDWILWAVLSVLCLYTHYLAIFFITIAGVIFILYKLLFYNNKETVAFIRIKNLFKSWKFLGAVLIIGVMFSFWLPAFQQHTSRKGLGWIPVAYLSNIPTSLQVFFLGHPPSENSIAKANEFKQLAFAFDGEMPGTLFGGSTIGLLILIGTCIGLVRLWQKNKWRKETFIVVGTSFGVLIFLILLSQIGKRFYVDRYFMPVAVLIYLLLGVIISQLKSKWQWVVIVGYIGLLFWLKPIPFDTSWNTILGDKNLVNRETIVIADDAFEYTIARFHLGEGRVKLYNQGQPEQDFSMWIVVKPNDQISKLDKYLSMNNVLYVGSWGYDWSEFNLAILRDTGRLKAGKVEEN